MVTRGEAVPVILLFFFFLGCRCLNELAVGLPHCPKDLGLHHFTAAAAKAVLQIHVPPKALFVGKNEILHSISPCWILYHLEKEVIIKAFQESPGLPTPCCVFPPRDISL